MATDLITRARGWKESDLRKFPTATLELIDLLANALAERAATPKYSEHVTFADAVKWLCKQGHFWANKESVTGVAIAEAMTEALCVPRDVVAIDNPPPA